MTVELGIPAKIENLIIRDWTLADAIELADIEYDPIIKKHFDLPTIPKENFISDFAPELTRGWAIEYTPSGTLAGTIACSKFGPQRNKFEIRIFLV